MDATIDATYALGGLITLALGVGIANYILNSRSSERREERARDIAENTRNCTPRKNWFELFY